MNSLARVMKADITIPDQLYSWDITYSGINYPWTVLLSLPIPRYFQTKVVGWKVYEEENSAWQSKCYATYVIVKVHYFKKMLNGVYSPNSVLSP